MRNENILHLLALANKNKKIFYYEDKKFTVEHVCREDPPNNTGMPSLQGHAT